MSCTLYFTKAGDPNVTQALILARFLGTTLHTQQIAKKYDPLILLTPEGTLTQPSAMLVYLGGQKLSGKDEREKLEVWQWFEHFNMQWHFLMREIVGQISGERPQSREKYEYALKELQRELEVVNSHLRLRTFMVGDAVTVVDISLAVHLEKVFRTILGEDGRKKLPNLLRWFTYIRSTAPFQEYMGEVVMCKEGHKVEEVKVEVKAEEVKVEQPKIV